MCLQASNCLLQIKAATSSSYSLCEDLPAGSGVKLYWSLDTATTQSCYRGPWRGLLMAGWDLGFLQSRGK